MGERSGHGCTWTHEDDAPTGAALLSAPWPPDERARSGDTDVCETERDRALVSPSNFCKLGFEGAPSGDTSLEGVRFGETFFSSPDFERAFLSSSNFDTPDFAGVPFRAPDVSLPDFCGTFFLACDFGELNLEGAQFGDTEFDATIFEGVPFRAPDVVPSDFCEAFFSLPDFSQAQLPVPALQSEPQGLHQAGQAEGGGRCPPETNLEAVRRSKM